MYSGIASLLSPRPWLFTSALPRSMVSVSGTINLLFPHTQSTRIYYYTSLSFFLYKNMTVVLLLNPKINYMTIPPVVPVIFFRTIPPCGNFSNHITRTFLNHSTHWFKLNDVYNGMILSPSNRGQMCKKERTNYKMCFFFY